MKQKFVKVSSLLMVIAFTFAGCAAVEPASKGNPTDAPEISAEATQENMATNVIEVAPIIVTAADGNSNTYTFDHFGISVDLPKDWNILSSKKKKKDIITFEAPRKDDKSFTALIGIYKHENQKEDFKDGSKSLEELLQSYTFESNVSHNETITYNNIDFTIVYYKYNQPKSTPHVKYAIDMYSYISAFAYFNYGDDFYYVALFSLPETAENYTKAFENVLKTFTFLD